MPDGGPADLAQRLAGRTRLIAGGSRDPLMRLVTGLGHGEIADVRDR